MREWLEVFFGFSDDGSISLDPTASNSFYTDGI